MPEDTIRMAFVDHRGGLDLKDTAASIKPNYFIDLANWHFNRSGGLVKRSGMTKFSDASFPLDGGSAVKGLFDARFSNATRDQYLVAVTTSGKVYTVNEASGVATLMPTTGATGQTNRVWTGFMYSGTSFILCADQPSVAQAYQPRRITSAAGVPAMAALGGSAPNAAFGAVHARKAWLAGDYANPLTLSWSKTGDVTDWTAVNDAGSLAITADYGQSIRGIFSWFGRLLVYLDHEIWQVTGTSGDPSSAAYFAISRVSNWIGASAHRTIAQVSTAPVHQSYKGVHTFAGLPTGFADVNETYLSVNIESTVNALSAAQLANSHAVNFRQRNWYCLASPGAGSIEPDTFLVYDYYLKAWTTFTSRLALTFPSQTIFQRDNGERWYVGASNGHVYRMETGLTDDGTIIQARFKWVTSLGDPAIWKKFRHLLLLGDYDATASLQVTADYDFAVRGTETRTMTVRPTLGGSFGAIGSTFTVGTSAPGTPDAVMTRADLSGEGHYLTVTGLNTDAGNGMAIQGWVILGDVKRVVPPNV